MLKSWSENGDIRYERFDYKAPIDWAFSIGAYKDLEVNGGLTYNWNTAGTGYIEESDSLCPYSIYAVNRTGSLPVSYIPGETDEITENNDLFLAEEDAYDFFSNLSNPELVRVVQYASMYQVFNNMRIRKNSNIPSPSIVNTDVLAANVSKILKKITEYGDWQQSAIDNFQYKGAYNSQKDYYSAVCQALGEKLDEAEFKEWFDQHYKGDTTLSSALSYLKPLLKDIKNEKTSNGTNALYAISTYVANPRNIDYDRIYENQENDMLTELDNIQLYAAEITRFYEELKTYNTIFNISPLPNVKKVYIQKNHDNSSEWIKCPTIVQSWSQRDSTYMIGGHNLSSKITPVRVNKNLSSGQYLVEVINGRKVISVSALDRGRITPNLLRTVERTNVKGLKSFNASLRTSKTLPVRPKAKVVAMSPKAVRGFNPVKASIAKAETSAIKINGKPVSSVDDLFAKIRSDIFTEQKTSIKELRFENISEDKVRVIIDGIQQQELLPRTANCRLQNSVFDMAHVEYDISKSATEGITIVKIPIKPQKIEAKAAYQVFELPTTKVREFTSILKKLLSNPKKFWNDFRLKREMRMHDLDPSELYEYQQYMISRIYEEYVLPTLIGVPYEYQYTA